MSRLSILARISTNLAVALALFASTAAHAQTTITRSYRVTFDATTIGQVPESHLAGPFSLGFQLVDGAGAASSTVQVKNAPFANFSLSDSSFFASHVVPISTSAPIVFDLDVTYDPEAVTPDQFSFAVLDSNLFELPAHGPADAALTMDFTDPSPLIQVFGGDGNRTTSTGHPGSFYAMPEVQELSTEAVPEPASLVLMLPALGVVALARRRSARNTEPAPDDEEAAA